MIFIVLISSSLWFKSMLIGDPEFWRNPRYLKRFDRPKYVPINFYRATSIKKLEIDHPKYIETIVEYSMKTYAWHNIKLIIQSDIYSSVVEPVPVVVEEITKTFSELLISQNIEHGIHMLFIYHPINPGTITVGHTLRIVKNGVVFAAGVIHIVDKEDKVWGFEHFTLSHELGHAFSVVHIEPYTSNCIAYEGFCVMISESSSFWPLTTPFPPAFSIQGFIQLRQYFDTYHKNDLLRENVNLRSYQMCGNGMVDPGEECDCGFEANCIISGEFECCDMTTCKLKSTAECSHGECCENCRLVEGAVCREQSDECDIADYCDGKSAFCPEDKKYPDGTACRYNEAYCVGGQCADADKMCKHLFPNTDSSAYLPDECDMNIEGLSDYDPDLSNNRHHKMKNSCGLLVCLTVGDIVNGFYVENKNHYANCSYVVPKKSLNFIGFVPNGNKCDENMMCLNNKCIDASENLRKCQNINCVDGTVCEGGVCVSEYMDFTDCRFVKCPYNEFCNKMGKCVKPNIPEWVQSRKIHEYPVYKSWIKPANRYLHTTSYSSGIFPWETSKTKFIHPMFEPNFETRAEKAYKYTLIATGYGVFSIFIVLLMGLYYFIITRQNG